MDKKYPVSVEHYSAISKLGDWLKTEPSDLEIGPSWSAYYIDEVPVKSEGEVIGKFIYIDDEWMYKEGNE